MMKNIFIHLIITLLAFSYSACSNDNSGSSDVVEDGEEVIISNKAITSFTFTSPAATGIINENDKK